MYDAGGNLLIDAAPGTTTLYLPDEELTLNTTAQTTSGDRYYTLGGAQVAVRSSTGDVQYLIPGVQGTSTISIDTSTQAVTRRFYNPFGGSRGTATGTFPTGQKGYVGGALDPSTGLENLGAREYAPSLGRFLSVDPVLETDSPQQLNGYDYAANNPVTSSDPSGLMIADSDGKSIAGTYATATQTVSDEENYAFASQEQTSAENDALFHRGAEELGDLEAPPPTTHHHKSPPWYDKVAHDVGGAVASQVNVVVGVGEGITNTAVSTVTLGAVNPNLQTCFDGQIQTCRFARDAGDVAAYVGASFVPGADEVAGAEAAADAAEGVEGIADGAEAIGDPGDAGEGADEGETCAAGGESFTPSTKIALADGTSRPLSTLKIGDYVKATNPKTGVTTPREISAVLVHHDTDLMDLTVRTGDTTSVIHTTADHPFWDTTRHAWTYARLLSHGDGLLTDDGSHASVAAVRTVAGAADMWDLTVITDHDFYILTGPSAVLVHNCAISDEAKNIAGHSIDRSYQPDGGDHYVRGVDPAALAEYVDGVLDEQVPNLKIRYGLNNGRVAYFDPDKGAVTILDGSGGTVLTPPNGEAYFGDLQ